MCWWQEIGFGSQRELSSNLDFSWSAAGREQYLRRDASPCSIRKQWGPPPRLWKSSEEWPVPFSSPFGPEHQDSEPSPRIPFCRTGWVVCTDLDMVSSLTTMPASCCSLALQHADAGSHSEPEPLKRQFVMRVGDSVSPDRDGRSEISQ